MDISKLKEINENAIGLMVCGRTAENLKNVLAGKMITVLDAGNRDEARRQCGKDKCEVLIFEKEYLRNAEDVFWGSEDCARAVCIDSLDIYAEPEGENLFMNRELWEMMGTMGVDDIEIGGWKNSYDGKAFSRKEMEEFSGNVYEKLKKHLSEDTRVLEIGCASGMTMFSIAPYVGFYMGTDLSGTTIERDWEIVKEKGMNQVVLKTCAAHEIETIEEREFDIVIINSVVQCFHGYIYLEKLIEKLIEKLCDNGMIFFGDIMDLDKKDALQSSIQEFADKNGMRGNLSNELFVPKRFFLSLAERHGGISKVECSDKIYTIENELTRYRYDAMVYIDKTRKKTEKKKIICDGSTI